MRKKVTTAVFRKMKATGEKITMLTAYDYPTARILDRSNIDAILVGDSLGMVLLGYIDTTQVTMEDMVHHIKAVSRGTEQAMVIGDLPFLSYHLGIEQSVRNAGRIIQEGHAQAVKLEGGREVVQEIKAIVKAGIPVMGHLGLTPQSIHQIGGYFVQGKSKEQAEKLIEDAKALEDAGVFAVVLECVPAELASLITQKLAIPTIGIGAGNGCDGQVLVTHDAVGIYQGKTATYVKQFAQLGNLLGDAVLQYVQEVKAGIFPQAEHSFHMEADELERLYGGANE
jgi:3-methyl-2-oxobutanoate hydroxymethyltransferase